VLLGDGGIVGGFLKQKRGFDFEFLFFLFFSFHPSLVFGIYLSVAEI